MSHTAGHAEAARKSRWSQDLGPFEQVGGSKRPRAIARSCPRMMTWDPSVTFCHLRQGLEERWKCVLSRFKQHNYQSYFPLNARKQCVI